MRGQTLKRIFDLNESRQSAFKRETTVLCLGEFRRIRLVPSSFTKLPIKFVLYIYCG